MIEYSYNIRMDDTKSLEDQIKELRDELNSIKNKVKYEKPSEEIGDLFGDYIETIIMGVSDKIKSSLDEVKLDFDLNGENAIEKKIRVKVKKNSKKIHKDELNNFFENAPNLMSALSDEKKLKILKVLEKGSKYQTQLSEITNIVGGSFKYHMDSLIAVNFVEQEIDRGKYKITQFGIESLKLVEMIYKRSIFDEKDTDTENIKIIIDENKEDVEITIDDD